VRAPAAIATFFFLVAPARAQVVDGVAAIVDKDVVLLSEVELSARIVLERIKAQQGDVTEPVVRTVYQEALQNLIDSKLIDRFAQQTGLVATPDELDRAIEGIAVDEGVAPEAVYQAAQQQGLSRESYRRELSRQITRMKVIQAAVRSRVTVTDSDVRELFDERYADQEPGLRVRVRHILIPWPEPPSPTGQDEARGLAGQVREKAIETGSFASLARQYSRAPSAADGGLTSFREGEVSQDIGDSVFTLPPGEVTEVIETEHGLNIFQIVNRFDPSEIEYPDVEDQLRAELADRKTMPEYEEWIEEQRENRYIEIVRGELRQPSGGNGAPLY
jgi:peptidyl-prolyl cis-trans isomerase SurA